MRNLLKIPRRFAGVNGGKYSGSAGVILEAVLRLQGGKREAANRRFVDPTLRKEREGWGTRDMLHLRTENNNTHPLRPSGAVVEGCASIPATCSRLIPPSAYRGCTFAPL